MASADATPDSANPSQSSRRLSRALKVAVFVLLCIGFGYLFYIGGDAYRQRLAIKYLRKAGAKFKVDNSQVGPKWVRQWIGEGRLSAFGRIQNLNCSDLDIGDEDIVHIKSLNGLEWLALNRCAITDEGARQLSEISTLRALRLDSTAVTDEGLASLARLKKLEVLSLNRTKITDAGLKSLLKLPLLRHLELDRTKLDDGALAELKDLKGIRELRLNETRISSEGIADLEKNMGIRITQKTDSLRVQESP